jgi:hypothetical protein
MVCEITCANGIALERTPVSFREASALPVARNDVFTTLSFQSDGANFLFSDGSFTV